MDIFYGINTKNNELRNSIFLKSFIKELYIKNILVSSATMPYKGRPYFDLTNNIRIKIPHSISCNTINILAVVRNKLPTKTKPRNK